MASWLKKTYKSGDRIEEIEVEKRLLQFLYTDDVEYVFMEKHDFSQHNIPGKALGERAKFLKEGKEYTVIFWLNKKTNQEEFLDIEIPLKINLKVEEAAPGVKGDTAASVYKDAVLENGSKVRVPLFVNAGDVVKVDTRTGEYIERAR